MKKLMASLLLSFLVLAIGFSNFFYSKEIDITNSRIPASQYICKPTLGDSCRINSDCCSFNCTYGQCQQRVAPSGFNGEPCNSNQNCFSRYCSANKKCAPSQYMYSNVGEYCENNTYCVSKYCDTNLKICRGSNLQKAFVGQFCKLNTECKSNHCLIDLGNQKVFRCLGSPSDYAHYNELCTFNDQCMSGYCDKTIYRCR